MILKSTNRSRTTWNIVKTVTNNRITVNNTQPMNINNKLTNNPSIIANAFNTYFSSLADNLITKSFFEKNTSNEKDPLIYLEQNFTQSFPPLRLKNTTTHEISKIIQSLKCKDSYGYDEVSTRILKISAPYILSPLTCIFNKRLATGMFPDRLKFGMFPDRLKFGMFPDRLKFAEVKPLFKKGASTEFCNYRPVSLLTSFSKIIEKIIYVRLCRHLNANNILVNEQFGFREKSSTEMATQYLLNTILSSLDKKNFVGGLFCDLQKAFNCVNHDVLLVKLEFYGISGVTNKLMKSYLNNRYQRTVIKDNMSNKISSEWELVKHGVPQGLILVPLLFLIYINDLSRTISKLANTILFADNTSIIVSNSNQDEFKTNINSVMYEIMNWFQSNLNCNKTHFLQFLTKKKKELQIQIMSSNSIISNLNSANFLGLTIDSTLSWKDHIAKLTIKLNKACYAIRTMKPFMTFNVLRSVYFSYFHSVMSYGIIFWGNSHFSANVFKIQKRIIRIMTNKGKRDSGRQLFKTLQILTVPSQYILSLRISVNKNGGLFLTNSEIHDINTRNNYNFHLPSTNLTLVQKGVYYSGSRAFNHLPINIKILFHDFKRFKSVLKNFLIEHSFYSLEEFYQFTAD